MGSSQSSPADSFMSDDASWARSIATRPSYIRGTYLSNALRFFTSHESGPKCRRTQVGGNKLLSPKSLEDRTDLLFRIQTVQIRNQSPQSGTHSVVHSCVPSGCVWHRISGCIPSGQASSALANLISLSCNPLMPCCDKCSWTFFKMPCACSCVRCLALLIGILPFLVGRC